MVTHHKTLSLATAMNAKIIGSGDRSLVLAHGFGCDQSVWEKLVPVLSQSFKVVVFDWVFSGAVKDQTLYDPLKYCSLEAFADDLIGLLEELKLESVVFLGHSMSGMIGCAASVKRPDLFESLLLLAASPRYINIEEYKGGFESEDIESIISSIESNYEAWASAFSSLVVDPKDSVSLERFERSLKKMKQETALELAKTVFGSDERELLGKVSVTCHIIQPGNDVVVPLSVAYYMQEKMNGKATVEIIGDAVGHFPHMTSHIDLLDVIKRLLHF